MIKKGSHLDGVEPINEKRIDNTLFLKIIETFVQYKIFKQEFLKFFNVCPYYRMHRSLKLNTERL